MAEFTLGSVTLEIPDAQVTPQLAEALAEGRYERQEARALRRRLRTNDRLLDLGAGAGYLSVLAAGIVGPQAVTAVEAHPEMLPVLAGNLARNRAGGVRIRHGAAVPDAQAGGTVAFRASRPFWGAALAPAEAGAPRAEGSGIVHVPALGFYRLLADSGASAVTMDIEGAEAALLAGGVPPELRLLIVEVHPDKLGAAATEALREAITGSGLKLVSALSPRDVWVFERLARAG